MRLCFLLETAFSISFSNNPLDFTMFPTRAEDVLGDAWLGITKFREGMWDRVATRRHTVGTVMAGSFGDDRGGGEKGRDVAEVMIRGEVKYRMKDVAEGQEVAEVVEWVAHGRVERDEEGGRWRFGWYRVWM